MLTPERMSGTERRKMDRNRNKKYFEQKNKTYPIIIASACIAVGFIMVVFLANTRGINRWAMTSLGLPLLVIGTVMWVIMSVVRIKDSEIDHDAAELNASFATEFKDHFEKKDVRRVKYDMVYGTPAATPKAEPVLFGTYCFDSEKALHKRGGDGKSRSSVYSLSGFLLRNETICLAEKKVSLVDPENDGVVLESFSEPKYHELDSAALVESAANGYSGVTRYEHLRITDLDGNTVIEFPILADASADEYVAEINTRIKREKERIAGNNV